jgi:hypothetical protein
VRTELAAVVQSAIEISRSLIEANQHELTVTLPVEPIYVDADLCRLAQACANLLNNAAKFTEMGGHIWLTGERQGNEVFLRIKDTGIGIAAEKLASIFEMFSQVDAARGSQGGLGIGLTFVRRLIEMHGGMIEARSGGLGTGSEFIVRLPVVSAAAEQKEAGRNCANPGRCSPLKPCAGLTKPKLQLIGWTSRARADCAFTVSHPLLDSIRDGRVFGGVYEPILSGGAVLLVLWLIGLSMYGRTICLQI